MTQPCIKFIAHTITYLAFIIMIILSSLQFSVEEGTSSRFSEHLDKILYKNYTQYRLNDKLVFKFDFIDFFIRKNKPTALDLTITIWITG